MTVRRVDVGGRVWKVRRRWVPHREGKGPRRRFAGKAGVKRRTRHLDWLDVPGLDFGDGIFAAIGMIIAVLVLVILLVVFVGPLALLGVDLVWLLGALLIGTFARFVLGHPWQVEAVAADRNRHHWAFQGFRVSGEGRDHVADRLTSGVPPTAISPPNAVASHS